MSNNIFIHPFATSHTHAGTNNLTFSLKHNSSSLLFVFLPANDNTATNNLKRVDMRRSIYYENWKMQSNRWRITTQDCYVFRG